MKNFICEQCHIYFSIKRNRKIQKYCSYKCMGIAKKLKDISCNNCGKKFKPKYSITIYCSKKCSSTMPKPKGKNSPIWKGGIHRRKIGAKRMAVGRRYLEIWDGNRWIGLHRNIFEKELGRKLMRCEHIHHINGNGLDNRRKNLVLLTIGQHNSFHKPSQTKNWKRNNLGQWTKL